MKYVVNVSPITNILGKEGFFIGTGFFGEEFETLDELKAIIRKYVCKEQSKPSMAQYDFKLAFSTAATVTAMKEAGSRQAEENGMVDLFGVAALAAKDPLYGKHVYFFRQTRCLKETPDKAFHYIIEEQDQYRPVYAINGQALPAVLQMLGVVL